MAEPETLAALNRGYVDTIMNTSKEAAARVMVSEMKARKYQQEIATVKDEAMNSLLRLKQMYDSKVKETEVNSLQQQNKVEELEGQLGEAEDIVGELRMELQVLRDEVNKLTNGRQTHLKSDDEEAVVSVVTEVSSSHKTSEALSSCNPVEQSSSVVANGITQCSSKDNKGRCHHTLPSILKKRRFADGCTHMIYTVGDVSDEVCLHKVTSCKNVENLEVSGCADGSDSTSCVFNDVRDGEDTKEHENETRPAIGETETRQVSASSLGEESPVSAVNKKQCIKYTFKRKRKKEVLSKLEGDSSNMKQKSCIE